MMARHESEQEAEQMPTNYDPQILQECADGLYAQAKFVILSTALKYGCITFLFSGVGCVIVARTVGPGPGTLSSNGALTIVVIATLLGIWAGVDAGRRLAFKWRLEAQQLLCQRQIEQNTRNQNSGSGVVPARHSESQNAV
jgi:hypothetical protein